MIINFRILRESTNSLFSVHPNEPPIIQRSSIDVSEGIRRGVDQDGRLRLFALPIAVLDVGAVGFEATHFQRQGVAEQRGDSHVDSDDALVSPVAVLDVFDRDASPSLGQTQPAHTEQDRLVQIPPQARDSMDDLLGLEEQHLPAAQTTLRLGLAGIGYALLM
ncbi:hypothetical protein RRF57_008530 [Xylaria bambusicola]|uniref:Uncharacterized protein n=1 Tax=Xylaria bambusicola TaxID=326684 RepID=A0AAN7UPK3_9PEZI